MTGLGIAVATVIAALITGIFGGIWTRRKNNISGAKEITESALLLIEPQNDRISQLIESVDQMGHQVDDLQQKIRKLERHVDLLTTQIITLGHTPITHTHQERGIE